MKSLKSHLKFKLLPGDWLVLGSGIVLTVLLFAFLWSPQPAARLRIRSGDAVWATLSLDQRRTLEVHGPLGVSRVEVDQGRARFKSSPCRNQYCVHQGWVARAGQVAACLPNRVVLELVGDGKSYDSLNY